MTGSRGEVLTSRVLAALGWLPVVALLPAAVLDRTGSGTVVLSPFPLGLSAWDPAVWESLQNSLLVASLVTLISTWLGYALARIAAPRFLGRDALFRLGLAPVLLGPSFVAVGWMFLAEVSRPLLSETYLVEPRFSWVLLVCSCVGFGVPLIASSVLDAIERVPTGWVDSGLSLGASRGRIWRDLVAPSTRPEAVRAIGAVFTISLCDPGPPIVLGLRRTLGYQLVQAADRLDTPGRLALLAGLAWAISSTFRLLLAWRAGPSVLADAQVSGERPRRASATRVLGAIPVLSLWIAISCIPFLGLSTAILGRLDASGGEAGVVSFVTAIHRVLDPDSRRIWANTLALGFIVAILCRLTAGYRLGARRTASIPAIVLASGAVLTPTLLGYLADSLLSSGRIRAGDLVGAISDGLQPSRFPGWLLIAAAWLHLSSVLDRFSDESGASRSLEESALSLGASRRRASRDASRHRPSRGFVTVFALACVAVSPGILLQPTAPTRTAGPEALLAAGIEPRRAAVIILGTTALCAVGFRGARRSGRPIGDWYPF